MGIETYQNRLLYLPCAFPNRTEFAICQYANKEIRRLTFDVVRLAMDLPYLPTERAKRLVFSPEYLYAETLSKNKKDRQALVNFGKEFLKKKFEDKALPPKLK